MKQYLLIPIFIFSNFISNSQDAYFTTNNLNLPTGSPSFGMNVTPEGDSSFILQLENPTKKPLQIWIRHTVLGTAIDTVVSKESYSCRYNLTNADDGKYIITVSNGKERYTREITLATKVMRCVSVVQ